MSRSVTILLLAAAMGGLAGCSSDYSPNTYASNAVQQANRVEPAVVAGYRQVSISANGTVGAVTGGAAGGILGAQVGSAGFNSALGTVGGTAIGSLIGTTLEHFSGDTTGWEYIVRKPNGELLSLTQREPKPLPVGQKVLVITGSQARIVPDYSVPAEAPPAAAEPPAAPAPEKPPEKPKSDIKAEPLEPPSGASAGAPAGAPVAPSAPASADATPPAPAGNRPLRLTGPSEPPPPAPAAEPTPAATSVPSASAGTVAKATE